ncbi:MAG: UDP-N-acetylmuramoyl-tripeptide--D-alanyl-D-alanine ligase [Mariprofundaceae bacterium]|nr:UDP-N-acetylmuramoyl-tripeptide--D-alanyl-D-alanine ligase [Mariprofundaceae bacterium]
MRLTGLELQRATRGAWQKGTPESINGISTDSRTFVEGHAFLALRGPNFDGHLFAAKVASKADALIGDHQGVRLWDNLEMPQLQVEDTLAALGDIANAWRNRLNRTTVIAITGSYGKTTIRSMLAHMFTSLNRNTAATDANLNNLIGVPVTLLGIDESAEIALIECGISEAGEMRRLSEIVQPDVAVITGLAPAHSLGLGGMKGVASEKAGLLRHLLPQGWCVFGEGVAKQMGQHDQTIAHDIIDMDRGDGKTVQWNLAGTHLTLSYGAESAELELPLPARHWAGNMALCATIALHYFNRKNAEAMPSLSDLAAALASWQPVEGRMRIVSGINGATIMDDSYNANPVSMQAALDTLTQLSGRTVAIIGDMAELDEPEHTHRSLNLSGINMLILVGNEMKVLRHDHADAIWFATTDEAVAWTEKNLQQFNSDDHILIKASRSMHLDRIVRAMAKREGMHAL